MAEDINPEEIKALVSLPFESVGNRKELFEVYYKVYKKKLCSTCGNNRIFAYNELKKYAEGKI